METKISHLISLFLIAVLITSCLKVENFPDEPTISFTNLAFENNEAVLNFSFTDGDGNFGINEDEADEPPFNENGNNKNLFLTYWELQNGEWQRFGNDFPLTSPFYTEAEFNARVEWLIPDGTNKTQTGDVSYNLSSLYYLTTSSFDTCRFSFFIKDRDFNESNTEFSSSFTKP